MIGHSSQRGPDPSVGWLVELVAAMEAVGPYSTPCDPSITEALQQRLRLPALLQPRPTFH